MSKEFQELKEQIRQTEQNFNYVDQEYIDAAIHELKAVEEKFRAMLGEKRWINHKNIFW